MHIRSRLAIALILTIGTSLPGLVVPKAGAADQLILGKLLLVKDPNPGVDPTKRSIIVFGKELASPNTLMGDPLNNGASVEVIANGASSTSQTFAMPAGAFTPGAWGWKTLGNPVFGYLYKDPSGVNGPVKIAFIKKVPSGNFLVKVLIKGDLGSITVLPPAPGANGGMRFIITGGDTYCVNFGGAAGGMVKNAPGNGVANKLFKVVSTGTAPTTENGCPMLAMGGGGVVLQGALTATLGRFNYNMMLGLPGANAACNTNFLGTHACTVSDLAAADAAGDLVLLQDTGGNPVTSFWAIDPLRPDLDQCVDDGFMGSNLRWEYQTQHTLSRGDQLPLDNMMGTLGMLVTGIQCNIAGTSWVGCCL